MFHVKHSGVMGIFVHLWICVYINTFPCPNWSMPVSTFKSLFWGIVEFPRTGQVWGSSPRGAMDNGCRTTEKLWRAVGGILILLA